jgi:hypothetical protein
MSASPDYRSYNFNKTKYSESLQMPAATQKYESYTKISTIKQYIQKLNFNFFSGAELHENPLIRELPTDFQTVYIRKLRPIHATARLKDIV